MMAAPLELCYIISCTVCLILVGEWTFHWMIEDSKYYIIAGIIYMIVLSTKYIQIETAFPMFIIFYVGEFVAWSLICKGELRNKLLKMLLIFYGISTMELSINVFWDKTIGRALSKELQELLIILLITGLFACITRQGWYIKIIEYLEFLSRWKLILILCVLIGGNAAIAFGNVLQERIDSSFATELYRIIMAIEMGATMVIIVWLIVESYQKKFYLEQNILKEQLLQSQQNYYKAIYEKEKEMRSYRHDIANHMGLLSVMMEQEEWNKAKEYLENINQEFVRVSFQKKIIGDDLLDAILNMMNQRASEKKINLEVKGKLDNSHNLNIYELCTIFSNAITNSIEACVEMECDGLVSISVLEHNGTLCCIFENPATEEMYKKILCGGTTKGDKTNHGYGIGNIQRAVARLQGQMEYRYETGKIVLEIFL